jgi:transcriptional regulator GlxA family with amidase domain
MLAQGLSLYTDRSRQMDKRPAPPPYVIGIVVYHDVDLLDVAVPAELFNWMGVVEQQSGSHQAQRVVRLVSADGPSVVTRDGLSLGAGLPPLEDAGPIDLLWVPGADLRSLGKLMLDARLSGFLQRCSATAELTVSVCEGALLLAAAGLLDGHRATTHWAFRDCLARFPRIDVAPYYPRYVVDGNRITGGGISSGLDRPLAMAIPRWPNNRRYCRPAQAITSIRRWRPSLTS